jgi:hypothetical protein
MHSTALERLALRAAAGIALLMFLFPLVSYHVPIAGTQDISGYDLFSKTRQFSDQVNTQTKNTPAAHTEPVNQREEQHTDPGVPFSMEAAWLIPLWVTAAFICAFLLLVGTFTNATLPHLASVVGTVAGLIAVVHLLILNSDMHTWMAASMKTSQQELAGNPFAGLANTLSSMMLNAFAVKPGSGLYVLVGSLAVAAVLCQSRLLTKFEVTRREPN